MENRSVANVAADGEDSSRWETIEAHAFEAVNFYATLWEILQFEWQRMVGKIEEWNKYVYLIVVD